jgi:hypothetical protein
MSEKESQHDAALLGRAEKHLDQRDPPFYAHLGADAGAAGDHHDPVFRDFGNLIGSRIGEMHGFTYMQFIVPGLIMMAVITNAYANVASSFFSAKFQRNIEELLVAPVPTHVIIAGYVGGGVARGCAWVSW